MPPPDAAARPDPDPGTQTQGITSDGAPIPWPVENPEMLDVYRARAGIPSFGAYTAAHAPK